MLAAKWWFLNGLKVNRIAETHPENMHTVEGIQMFNQICVSPFFLLKQLRVSMAIEEVQGCRVHQESR